MGGLPWYDCTKTEKNFVLIIFRNWKIFNLIEIVLRLKGQRIPPLIKANSIEKNIIQMGLILCNYSMSMNNIEHVNQKIN